MLVCDWIWMTALMCAMTAWVAFYAGVCSQRERGGRKAGRW